MICLLATSPTLASGANREGQARGLLIAIVSRVATGYTIGKHVDLPLTMWPCKSLEAKNRTYDEVRSVLRGSSPREAYRNPLCHPFKGESQFMGESPRADRAEGQMTFLLPQEHCTKMRATIASILNEVRVDIYNDMLDQKAQSRVYLIFQGHSHGFPNSTGLPSSKYFEFAVQDCRDGAPEALLTILMRKRK